MQRKQVRILSILKPGDAFSLTAIKRATKLTCSHLSLLYNSKKINFETEKIHFLKVGHAQRKILYTEV